ncbi:MAG TPA: iron ABC transporter permease [Microbacteriaceae bacterium]|nr:iron ABC transporter permease [Microbacteriaceae bacterium]
MSAAAPARTTGIARPERGRPRPGLVAGVALAGLLVLAAADLVLGIPDLGFGQVARALAGGGSPTVHALVVGSRLPRLVVGAEGGALLALAGLLLQDVMRNPLAGPELLGVSSGSAAVMAVIITLALPVPPALQVWLALAGGALGGGVVVWGARFQRNALGVILIGVAVSALLNAVITTLISLGSQANAALFYSYLVGTLQGRGWLQAGLIAPWLAVVAAAFALAGRLSLLRVGETAAVGLGVRVGALRVTTLILAVAAVCAVVAVCGPIGYVALLAPHVARRLVGTGDTRRVLPAALVIGAVLLTAADLLGRVVFTPLEVPAGVWTTLLGGPLLILVLGNRFER